MRNGITLKVRRIDPSQGGDGRFDNFHIPAESAEGMTIVDALRYIQENVDPTLAFYYSCELARCRGCVMDVDGEATFACTKPAKDGQTIEPLTHLPVIKDLVVKFIESKVALDQDACTGCGECVKACPMDIYAMGLSGDVAEARQGGVNAHEGHAVDCIGCKRCQEACPVDAIQIEHLSPHF
jgi:succinate dehydrogenase/fumarate reductase-like Fe-S protein